MRDVNKYLPVAIAMAFASKAFAAQPAGLKCVEDRRPMDGSLSSFVLSKEGNSKYQVEVKWESGGMCPDACPEPQSAVVIKGMKCDFGTSNKNLVECSLKESNDGVDSYSFFHTASIVKTTLKYDLSNKKWIESDQQEFKAVLHSPYVGVLESEELKSILDRTWGVGHCEIIQE
jgi:hypothetical protein